MIALELRFLAGRFHATPWGRHVNEGAVEWPPSPWRIMRALIATWHLKARDEVTQETVAFLISRLAETQPRFVLPPARLGHTRHYMPVIEGKNNKTTKVFDTFVQMDPDEPLVVVWNVTLEPPHLKALHILAGRLGFFGRAESLVEARVLEGIGAKPNAAPISEEFSSDPSREVVQLLAAMSPEEYRGWRRDFLVKATEALGPKPTKAQLRRLPALPESLLEALQASTGDLQSAGWSLPPGSVTTTYTRSSAAFAPAPRRVLGQRTHLPTVARYAIVSAVCPRLTQTVSVANRVHEALCKWSDQSSVFTGRDQTGRPLSDHNHAHVFCEANGPRDTITHLTVWAKAGFDEGACLALRRLNRVWGHGGHDIRLVLLGLGGPAAFPDCLLFGSSLTWRSCTPFVSTRHEKTYRDGRPKMDASGWQIGSAAHDLLRLLALNSDIGPVTIRAQSGIEVQSRLLRCIQFQTARHDGGGSRGIAPGAAFTLTFEREVEGPLAFGYGAHFGLGLFAPVGP
jgi:CRISPR-associated protein Csb2